MSHVNDEDYAGKRIPDEQLASGYIYVDGIMSPDTNCSSGIHVDCMSVGEINYYSFMSWSTCIHLYPATDGRQTGDNFVVDTRNMLTTTSECKWIQLVSGNMYPSVNAALDWMSCYQSSFALIVMLWIA